MGTRVGRRQRRRRGRDGGDGDRWTQTTLRQDVAPAGRPHQAALDATEQLQLPSQNVTSAVTDGDERRSEGVDVGALLPPLLPLYHFLQLRKRLEQGGKTEMRQKQHDDAEI